MSQQQQTLELEAQSEKMARDYLHGSRDERVIAKAFYNNLTNELNEMIKRVEENGRR